MDKFTRSILCTMLLVLSTIVITACGVMEVRGKTFVYDSVEIDWGLASEEDKQSVYDEFLVSNENELLNVLRTRNNRNQRITTFGTDATYTTIGKDGKILDKGYYKQDSDTVTLAETENGFANAGKASTHAASHSFFHGNLTANSRRLADFGDCRHHATGAAYIHNVNSASCNLLTKKLGNKALSAV